MRPDGDRGDKAVYPSQGVAEVINELRVEADTVRPAPAVLEGWSWRFVGCL